MSLRGVVEDGARPLRAHVNLAVIDVAQPREGGALRSARRAGRPRHRCPRTSARSRTMSDAASWLWSATPIDPSTRTGIPAASVASMIRTTSASRIARSMTTEVGRAAASRARSYRRGSAVRGRRTRTVAHAVARRRTVAAHERGAGPGRRHRGRHRGLPCRLPPGPGRLDGRAAPREAPADRRVPLARRRAS